MVKAFKALILLGLLVSAPAQAEQSPDYQAMYKKRFASLMENKGVLLAYDPQEAVPGAQMAKPIPIAKKPSISAAALDAATHIASISNSSAFIVWRNGKIETQSFFNGKTASTPLLSRSLSKPMTALAVGRAIALGKITSLDQPVVDFIPEWKGTPKDKIIVRHLLDMRSGLLEQMFSLDPDHPINRAYLDPDHGRYIVENYPLTHPPGSYYGYGNAVSELVAVLIERATGRRYAEFIGNEVLKPIGAPGGSIWVNRPGGLAHSGCCMYLPAESWLRMGILLAQDGKANGRQLLPKGYVAEMRRPTAQNPNYGLGLWTGSPYLERRGFSAPGKPGPKILQSEPYLDRNLFLFDGNASQVVYILPASNMVILRLGDQPPKEPEWDNAKLPNLLIRGLMRTP